MTQLTKQSVETLAQLSRIDCSEEETEMLLKDLSKILAYIEQLQEIDTDNVPVCNHVLSGMVNAFRNDAVGETLPRELFLANAPSQIGGMIRVPPVMKPSTP